MALAAPATLPHAHCTRPRPRLSRRGGALASSAYEPIYDIYWPRRGCSAPSTTHGIEKPATLASRLPLSIWRSRCSACPWPALRTGKIRAARSDAHDVYDLMLTWVLVTTFGIFWSPLSFSRSPLSLGGWPPRAGLATSFSYRFPQQQCVVEVQFSRVEEATVLSVCPCVADLRGRTHKLARLATAI